LTRPFLFTAGSIRPYRGLEDAVAALPEIVRMCGDLSLVIGGEAEASMRPYQQRLQRQAEALGCADRILWCGKLDQQEMAWCFQQCRVFLMTSRVEACPNTVLEAMSQGCLSVSTDCPPMPEMYGETALFYKVGDAARLAQQVRTALGFDADQRRLLQDSARRRAAGFSWHRTVEETVRQLILAAGLSEARQGRKIAA
jgi:glycosyltransferase involved in cell wall biosynthesis